jgi:predicted AAA+ superfamily ATPase
MKIKDNYEKIILTMDKIFVDTNENGIKIYNIIDWLLK